MLALLLAVSAGAAPAAAQQDPDTAIRLNLSPPGARSLALGGAFLGLADDATAAYTNPAGLTNLTLGGSEVAVEVRHAEFRNSFLDRGHDLGSPGGLGIDTIAGFERSDSSEGATGLSFLSFAKVLPRGWTVAVYRHELARFVAAFETQGALVGPPCPLCVRITPRRSKTELEIINYGMSAAFELALPTWKGVESTLSLGAGVSYYQLDLLSFNENFFAANPGRETGDLFGPPDYLGDNAIDTAEQIGDGDAFGVNVGWLWKLGRARRWSLGGVFRQGAEFDTTFIYRPGGVGRLLGLLEVRTPGLLTVPDFFGLGVAFRTGDGKTRLTLDLSRTRYSQQRGDYLLAAERFRETVEATGDPFGLLDGFDAYLDGFRIQDSDEVHLGFERVVLVVESLFVGTARAGLWNEPFHELEYVGDDVVTRALLDRPKGDELHYSLGFGLVVKEDYQIDFAVDLSDVTNTISLSLVKFL